jgi:hypothetical protein
MFNLLATLTRGLTVRPTACPTACPHDRPPRPAMVEGLEARALLSAAPAAGGAAAALVHGPAVTQSVAHQAAKAANPSAATSVLPIQITGVGVNNGQLVALGKIGSQVFSLPLTLSATPAAANDPTAVPILHLRIDPIHLDLLGLKVDTSPICLDIAAQPGSGNLLGNLLAGVANLLNQGTPLGNILGGLTSTQLTSLTTGLLNGVFGAITAPGAVTGVGSTGTGGNGNGAHDTNILHLSLGPVDLNLLGLTVSLDNCNNGPVTVDITAESGSGNLLGNLLSGLSHALDRGATAAIDRLIGRIADRIGQLV